MTKAEATALSRDTIDSPTSDTSEGAISKATWEPVPAASDRRARRRAEIHGRLYATAIELFVEQGFEATTMDAIAARADVARGTVFNHFPRKVAFLQEWGRRRRDRVAAALAEDQDSDASAPGRLHRYLQEMAALNTASRAQTVVLMEAATRNSPIMREDSLAQALAGLIREGQAAGDFERGLPADSAGALLSSGYFSTVLRWTLSEPPPFDLVAQLDEMLEVVLNGLLVSPRIDQSAG